MIAIQRWMLCLIVAAALLLAGWFAVLHYGAGRYQAGYAAAISAGKAQHDLDAAAALKTESSLRAQLAKRDADAHQKEIEHAQALADAQRRVRAGIDRLRCPASPISTSSAPADRSVTSGPTVDGPGPDLVPQAAADVLGYGAAIAGLVRRYERVVKRFEDCRAVNSKY